MYAERIAGLRSSAIRDILKLLKTLKRESGELEK